MTECAYTEQVSFTRGTKAIHWFDLRRVIYTYLVGIGLGIDLKRVRLTEFELGGKILM